MTIYIVVETGWDHHVNMGVFDSYDQAADIRLWLEEKKEGLFYGIEEMTLNEIPLR